MNSEKDPYHSIISIGIYRPTGEVYTMSLRQNVIAGLGFDVIKLNKSFVGPHQD